ncbi:hypothetical protein CJ671_00600 [Aliarcobacter cryaerophilus]|uniref:Uncharacterized protein n=1 Tax=Aliarcobacter cryaerophilus TaxID=28198 RepID=A0A2S9SWD2_9BACT|nr:hypothetical protein [Aliarcobacter cryaerophilus]PRM90871.1 hypothetical protein CJ671_00600 [Aliarcobacter cryaerophilus]
MNSNNQVQKTRFVVKDAKGIFLTFLGIVPSIFIYYNGGKEAILENLFGLIFTGLAVICFLRLRAIWSGVVVDTAKNTLIYYGGKKSANSFFEYFSPIFWFQYFLRFKVKLNEISQMHTTEEFEKGYGENNYKWVSYIQFDGNFGTFKIKFTDKGKRDQLYSLVRSVNQMGSPIFMT